jgi:hypothetical protein
MSNLEQVKQSLLIKESRLNGIHQIITPETGVDATTQATWMINLLQQIYTEHGIAKSPQKVIESIARQECRCWFILENNQPVAMTALVQQSDGSVELGRAVAISPGLGLGGIAMMRAGLDQLENSQNPLVAEVRVADTFEGVPSGEATQKILFGQFGIKPHALAPMFNHGQPVRQEMFALATSQEKVQTEDIIVPENRRARQQLQPALTLGENIFANSVRRSSTSSSVKGFELVQDVPFSIVVPNQKGAKLETVEAAGFEANNFILLPVELTDENSATILGCLEAGWVACGVDRNVGDHSHPVLLLGKLKAHTLLAPSKIDAKNLDRNNAAALQKVDKAFRA